MLTKNVCKKKKTGEESILAEKSIKNNSERSCYDNLELYMKSDRTVLRIILPGPQGRVLRAPLRDADDNID